MPLIQHAGIGASLPKVSAKPVFRVELHCIREMAAMKSFPYGVFLFRDDHEVNVVGHQTICEYAQRKESRFFGKQAQILKAVGVIAKYIKAANPTLSDMVSSAGHYQTSRSTHVFFQDTAGGAVRVSAGRFVYYTRSASDQPN